MINRLLIRTRVMQTAYAHLHRGSYSMLEAEADLVECLASTYDLYLYLLNLPLLLSRKLEQKQAIRKAKFLATKEDLSPNTRLVNNLLSRQIESSDTLKEWYRTCPYDHGAEDELSAQLLQLIEASPLYRDYLQAPVSYATDQRFWIDALKTIVFPSQELATYLENLSVYWANDLQHTERIICEDTPEIDTADLLTEEAIKSGNYSHHRLESGIVEVVKDFVEKTLKRASEHEDFDLYLMPMYKDEDDAKFATHLLRHLLKDQTKLSEILQGHISANWDKERLADLDLLILQMAVAELLYFPNIPSRVTINEYIEIAKDYSTPKSGYFINGVLHSTTEALKREGKIFKE